MRFALILALLAFPLAAQRAPGDKTILNEIRVMSHRAVAMRDGVTLYADIYLPKKAGKYPTIVVRTCYGVQRDGVHDEMIRFAQNGFAVVMQDGRGRYESDGKWTPFFDEAKDGYDTIEWAAKQPWSNGKVGTQGGSYLGWDQWAAIALAPPSLVTAFPRVASTSIYKNWAYFGGAFRLSFNYGWGVVRMPFRIMQPQFWHSTGIAPDEMKYEKILWTLPLKTADLAAAGTEVDHWRKWVDHATYDDYWKLASVEERFGDIKVPVHTHGGWFDIFLAGTINGYVGMKHLKGTKMTVGPWGHGPSTKFGEVDFGAHAMRSLPERELQWFNYYLKGEQNGLDREPPVEIFYMGANKWAKHADWPVPGTQYKPLYLDAGKTGGGKVLAWEKPAVSSEATYAYDPANPVMTLGGNNCCGTPTLAGPYDQRPLEKRGDVLSYTSDLVKDPLAIAGPVRMKLWAATDGPDTDWMVKLIDVAPNGFAMPIAEGILRARFRGGLDKPELLKAGEAYEFDIDMVGTANVFQPGHRIRIDITSSNFPQFDRNLNTGDPVKMRVAKNTVFHAPLRASHIVLPVVALP